eukprot:TRINITY_DN1212_c0_g1_i2.p1 TRINITY_DN1212_c0_g1~~TRINITY_DN1212_c0_g1_i2.p1  ORF type:complete len:203 (+),score=11.51 TRINITY_DN1212_c0_g1_i2:94-702(+)
MLFSHEIISNFKDSFCRFKCSTYIMRLMDHLVGSLSLLMASVLLPQNGASVFLSGSNLYISSYSTTSKLSKRLSLSTKRPKLLTARGVTPSQVDAGSPPQKDIVQGSELSIDKLSFGVVGLALGGTLLLYGFGAYFSILPGSEWSALMLTYGFPVAIIGMALKYAELKPVPCITYSDALALRESNSTPTLNQVKTHGWPTNL